MSGSAQLLLVAYDASLYAKNFFSRTYRQFMAKYAYVDSFFYYQGIKIFTSTVGEEFFDNPQWAYYLACETIVFTFFSNRTFNPGQYAYFLAAFTNHEIVYLPFAWYTKDPIFDTDAGYIRASNNAYYQISSVGKTPISYLKETDPLSKTIYSNPTALVATSTSALIGTPSAWYPFKLSANGVAQPFTTFVVVQPTVMDTFLIYNLIAGTTVTASYHDPQNCLTLTSTLTLISGINVMSMLLVAQVRQGYGAGTITLTFSAATVDVIFGATTPIAGMTYTNPTQTGMALTYPTGVVNFLAEIPTSTNLLNYGFAKLYVSQIPQYQWDQCNIVWQDYGPTSRTFNPNSYTSIVFNHNGTWIIDVSSLQNNYTGTLYLPSNKPKLTFNFDPTTVYQNGIRQLRAVTDIDDLLNIEDTPTFSVLVYITSWTNNPTPQNPNAWYSNTIELPANLPFGAEMSMYTIVQINDEQDITLRSTLIRPIRGQYNSSFMSNNAQTCCIWNKYEGARTFFIELTALTNSANYTVSTQYIPWVWIYFK